jgi:hypothetical protein
MHEQRQALRLFAPCFQWLARPDPHAVAAERREFTTPARNLLQSIANNSRAKHFGPCRAAGLSANLTKMWENLGLRVERC